MSWWTFTVPTVIYGGHQGGKDMKHGKTAKNAPAERKGAEERRNQRSEVRGDHDEVTWKAALHFGGSSTGTNVLVGSLSELLRRSKTAA
jgi:hypothetical protein